MADKLLIRLFDVGLGDCIYCRVPKAHAEGRDFHILIDCGTLSSTEKSFHGAGLHGAAGGAI
jgi:hypothetical protein